MQDRIVSSDGPLVDGARSAEAVAGRVKDRVVEGVKGGIATSRAYVTENPMTAVLVAVGAGAIVGYLLGRRSSHGA